MSRYQSYGWFVAGTLLFTAFVFGGGASLTDKTCAAGDRSCQANLAVPALQALAGAFALVTSFLTLPFAENEKEDLWGLSLASRFFGYLTALFACTCVIVMFVQTTNFDRLVQVITVLGFIPTIPLALEHRYLVNEAHRRANAWDAMNYIHHRRVAALIAVFMFAAAGCFMVGLIAGYITPQQSDNPNIALVPPYSNSPVGLITFCASGDDLSITGCYKIDPQCSLPAKNGRVLFAGAVCDQFNGIRASVAISVAAATIAWMLCLVHVFKQQFSRSLVVTAAFFGIIAIIFGIVALALSLKYFGYERVKHYGFANVQAGWVVALIASVLLLFHERESVVVEKQPVNNHNEPFIGKQGPLSSEQQVTV